MAARVYDYHKFKLIKERDQLILDYESTFEHCAKNERANFYDFQKLFAIHNRIAEIQDILEKQYSN